MSAGTRRRESNSLYGTNLASVEVIKDARDWLRSTITNLYILGGQKDIYYLVELVSRYGNSTGSIAHICIVYKCR